MSTTTTNKMEADIRYIKCLLEKTININKKQEKVRESVAALEWKFVARLIERVILMFYTGLIIIAFMMTFIFV